MQTRNQRSIWKPLFSLVVTTALLAASAQAMHKKTIHSFTGASGEYPLAGVVIDGSGNIYGTTPYGGSKGGGAVYKLSVDGSGNWTESVIYNFSGAADGGIPYGNLTLDAFGNVYGAAYGGGAHGAGIIFMLSPGVGAEWKETIVYDFGIGAGGANPAAGITFGTDGSIYGTLYNGGNFGKGAVFQLKSDGHGGWAFAALHYFNNDGKDGYNPWSSVIFDAAGNLYGTTINGGTKKWGTVYQLTPNGDGTWNEKVLQNFDGTSVKNGGYPYGGVHLAKDGSLYGTTQQGGKSAFYGTFYSLTPGPNNTWKYTLVKSFTGSTDGGEPMGALIEDAAGNLYGTAMIGKYSGLVFEFSLKPNGKRAEKVLYRFTGTADGAYPNGALAFDASGRLYSTTKSGGANDLGTVFQLY